jgi:hypothetical protein
MSYEEVHALFRLYNAPVGLLADLVEYPGGNLPPEYYNIRLYRSNFDKLTWPSRFATMEWVRKTIEAMGAVTPCAVEIWQEPTKK